MKRVAKEAVADARLCGEDQPVLSSIEDIIADIRAGKPVIIVDDEDRENEGDLIVAAQMATPDIINFMAREARGLICLPMERAMVDRLGLELMGRGDNAHHKTAFTVSIEAQEGVTTGISAADRARTISVAIDPNSTPSDIATPGHVFPLMARDGGVLVRAGHTEAAVDLARLAGFSGAGVICEIMNDDGTMARLPDLVGYAQRHNLKIGTIADLIAYRRRTESLVRRVHETEIKSRHGGNFRCIVYANTVHYEEHIALIKGNPKAVREAVPVRMHSVNLLNDILGVGGESPLRLAMEAMADEPCGVIVVIRDTGSHSLSNRLEAMTQIDASPLKPSEKILRNYGIGAQILLDLGIGRMILMTDHPVPVPGLEGYGLEITGFRPLSNEGKSG